MAAHLLFHLEQITIKLTVTSFNELLVCLLNEDG